MKNNILFNLFKNKTFKKKGFVSIEVMIISLVCSILVTILMENSFKNRATMERRYDLIDTSLSINDEEEIFLKKLIEKDVINKETIKGLDFSDGNLKATYDESKDALRVSNKNQDNGVYKQSYYDYRFDRENNILLKRRRYYEFTN